ncbi:ATP-binding protein [Kitasatospora sp. NPDC127116]|uniref:ATP-binding protein n=1 Tax=Kitasatospora sp. NPDC127116 TaxID=3345367 RepID=UPI00362FFAF2
MEPRSRTITTQFPAKRAQLRDLRRWAREALPLLGLDPHQVDVVQDGVELVLSELGTNAVVHGCGGDRPDVTLTASLEYVAGVLRVSVTDPGPGRPEHRPVDDEATCGRGLRLVNRLASRFGVDPLPEGGKAVWAEVTLPASARSTAALAEQVGLQIAVLRAGTALRESRPRPAVGMLPGQPALDRIPA